jgi:hypothetical protein
MSIQAFVTSFARVDETKQPASGVANVPINVTGDFLAAPAEGIANRIVTVGAFSGSASLENADACSV